MDIVELSAVPLSLDRYVTAVADDGAGAISTFIGVTRDTFEGKKVVRLEYEAYHDMVRCQQSTSLQEMRDTLRCVGVAGVARRCGAHAPALAAQAGGGGSPHGRCPCR